MTRVLITRKRTPMRTDLRARLCLAALALCACHVRAIPFSTPPGFSVSKEAREGQLGRKQDVTLSDEGNQYIAAFRYELPAPGGLIATAKPVNPQAQISVAIFSEGSGNEPIAKGALGMKFDNHGANLSAEFVPPQGAPEKIDPVAGLAKNDLAAGDYFIKVYANDAGDAGRYRLATSFKQGDTCKNGGPACSLEGAEELKLPSDSKTADVDYSRSKQFHFYRATFKERGKLTITFKVLQPQRGSKLAAYFMKNPDDEGDRISGTSVTKEIDQPGEFYIRVQAPESGDYGKYAIATIFQPSNFIPADVVEIGRSPCLLTVSAGTNQGVRAGFGCTVVNASGQAIDSCVVDQTFPNLSKVKPASTRCNVAPNAKVQITAQ